ncbi:hypothetical protein [Flammeovirga aprica]|uniref:Uncharacterized protein n=1 Tax=Flammeovirga aprica JL-4 TaxID=694437 RepID=A0A7X9XDF8_9BACT|nr:hypothetical protein [Flammeovirga aprica]NME72851.1 hypothetical protein [Flammeovirga aprica JL-4]
MQREIRFFSIGKQPITKTKSIIQKLCDKKGWDVGFMELDSDNTITGQINQSESNRYSSDYLTLLIRDEEYSQSWSSGDNLKAYHIDLCYYILEIEVFYKWSFLLDFSISLLENCPNIRVESLDENEKTFFEEFTLQHLYQVKKLGYEDNWKQVKLLR